MVLMIMVIRGNARVALALPVKTFPCVRGHMHCYTGRRRRSRRRAG